MIRAVGVVVPSMNEQASIKACLDSVEAARARLRSVSMLDVAVLVVVVLDSCVDQTAAIVRRSQGVVSVSCSMSQASGSRMVGAQWLLTHTFVRPRELWLANTDADSTVPMDWITTQLWEAEHGAHLVLGTVLPEPGLAPTTEQAWYDYHQMQEGHLHVHGANFGIRADVLTGLGGWPDVDSGEDVTLARRAASAGHLQIARTARIPVRTSVRTTGRAPHGFAGYLSDLVANEEQQLAV